MNDIDPQLLAERYCNKGEFDCRWYHGNWHLLKSLGIVSTSAVHELSICKLLKLALDSKSHPRILLTGSTDETLIHLVHDTCSALGIKEKLFAVDICATPLAFMQAYADNNNIELTTYHSNILEFEPGEKFDIILTHAFMGYFDDTQRRLLVKKWYLLLSDQGKVVTIQRVRPEQSPSLVRFTPQQSIQFIDAAIKAAKHTELGNDNDLKTVEVAATEFTNNFVNHAITSKTALESLFLDAGLNFEHLEYHALNKKGELSGPSVPSDAEFAHIIASKSSPANNTANKR